MSYNKISMFQQTLVDAEQQGSAFAEIVKDSFSGNEKELGNFVDMLFYLYYLMDNKQFIDFLIILSNVFDAPLSPGFESYRTDDEKVNVFIPIFLETFFYAVLAVGGEAD